MVMPGRSYAIGTDYRYGFNGKERDKNMSSLTAYDYGFRIYNPALGRFLSVDPLTSSYPQYSPYHFAGNNPIANVDLDGLEPKAVVAKAAEYQGTIYEWGGKNPIGRWKAVYPKLQTQIRNIIQQNGFDGHLDDEYINEVITPVLRNISLAFKGVNSDVKRKEIYNSLNYNLNSIASVLFDEVKFGKASFGIDCSGLARLGFNADEQKLMGNFSIMTAQNMHDIFRAQIGEGKGILHKNFDYLGTGDLVFRQNKKGDIVHVMVATANVRLNTKTGQISEFEVIQAPVSGKLVAKDWIKIKDNLSIGHTYRMGDETTPFKQGVTADDFFENLIKTDQNLAKFKNENQHVEPKSN
jgi:RHS repeat-associated protein